MSAPKFFNGSFWTRLNCGTRRNGRGRRSLRFALESLESRRLLATLSGDFPAIEGRVFVDADQNSAFTAGEEVQGASIQLFQDDGDGLFEPGAGDTQVGPATTTDATGVYCFDNLGGMLGYFVFQPAQTADGEMLVATTSALIRPGNIDLLIDDFENPGSELDDAQELITTDPPPVLTQTSTKLLTDETHVMGQERDALAQLNSGSGTFSVRVDVTDSNRLQFATSGGVSGNFNVTWDGVDMNANVVSLGLNGRDLTQGGENTGLGLQLGVDTAGNDVRIRIYQGDSVTFTEVTAQIPITAGGVADEYLFIPFSSFVGPVSPDNVDAIQLLIATTSAADGEIEIVGAVGPKTADFLNAAGADLSITKTTNPTTVTTVTPGGQVQYTITVTNNGPMDVTDATVQDLFDVTRLAGVTYTSAVTGTVSGNTSGTGNIFDVVDMAAGSAITYSVSAIVLPDATGELVNTATVTHADDSNPDNNSASTSNTLRPQADLSVTKDDGETIVGDGATVTYSIVVTNGGPSNVVGATVADTFPSGLTSIAYTSTTTGTVTGNTATGTGNISDTVSMSPLSTITYTVTATVDANGATQVDNVATVTAPQGTDDPDPTNNSAGDVDTVTDEFDLVITKTDNVSSIVPGQVLTYIITVSNEGPSDVTGATVSDSFPAAALSNVSYTATIEQGIVTGLTANGIGNINDTLNLSAGSLVTYTVTATVRADAVGPLTNTASVTARSGGPTEDDTTNNTRSDTDEVERNVDLVITKTASPTAVRGGTVTYTIIVRNDGPTAVLDAPVSDTFPTGLTGIGFTSVAAGGASGNTLSGTGNISDLLDLPVNGQVTYTVNATVAGTAPDQLMNTATVTAPSGFTETDTADNSATANVTVSNGADLTISKSDSTDTIGPGDQTTYSIVVRNVGTVAITGARVVDTFPASLNPVAWTSAATGGATDNQSPGTGNIDDVVNIPVNGQITYTVTATLSSTATGTVVNTATVGLPDGLTDVTPNNNTATDTDMVRPEADLSITKTNNVTNVNSGQTLTYTITVSNAGPDAVTGARVRDTFSNDFTAVTYTSVITNGASGNTATGAGNINDTVNVPANSTIVYTVSAQVVDNTDDDEIANMATVTADGVNDTNANNNSATDTDTVDAALAQLSGFVYVDEDNDGIFDEGETPISGVTINLRRNGTEIDDTTTDSTGAYSFTNLDPGTYEVMEEQPAQFNDGRETAGGIGSSTQNDVFTVPLAAGDNATGLNFGESIRQPSKRDLLASSFRG